MFESVARSALRHNLQSTVLRVDSIFSLLTIGKKSYKCKNVKLFWRPGQF